MPDILGYRMFEASGVFCSNYLSTSSISIRMLIDAVNVIKLEVHRRVNYVVNNVKLLLSLLYLR